MSDSTLFGKRFTRRTLLKGAVGVAAALPLTSAAAQAEAPSVPGGNVNCVLNVNGRERRLSLDPRRKRPSRSSASPNPYFGATSNQVISSLCASARVAWASTSLRLTPAT